MKYYCVYSIIATDDSGFEPVSLEYAKEWMKVETDDDDGLINHLITTARVQCEDFTNTCLKGRTLKVWFNNSAGGINLPYCPLQSMVELTTDNGANVIDEDNYSLFGIPFPRLEYPKEDRMTAEYIAGFETLPEPYMTAIMQQIGFLYENRGDVATHDKKNNLCELAKQTLTPYRRIW